MLIPKMKNPRHIAEYCPISLCNVTYKLVSKVLVNRMKGILNDLISHNQIAFIPGRCVVDNAILGYECIHVLRAERKGKVGWALLKLDMSKTYDRVEWVFLEKIMLKMGFAPAWIELISLCISSVRFSFNVNGYRCGDVKPSRGLRQGDPLSPYLFLLCAEGLSCMLPEAEVNHAITWLKVSRHGPTVSHLFFADDSLLFFRAKVNEVEVIQSILRCYECASGQTINFDKSIISFSPSTDPGMQEDVRKVFQVQFALCHRQYLGLPSFMPRNRTNTLSFIKDRIWRHIHGWKGKLFSVGGREVLLKSIVQAILCYTMNCFRLQKKLLQDIYQ